MAARVKRICPVCQKPHWPRTADVNRGWGVYDTKRCKAIAQERAKALAKAGVSGTIPDPKE